jgi:hypothetical protein
LPKIFVFLNRVEGEKLIEEIPNYKAVVQKFTTNEIISQSALCDSFEKELRDQGHQDGKAACTG